MIKARVFVTLKPGVLDPQGKAIEGALKSFDISGIESVRQGRMFDVELAGEDTAQARETLVQSCEKLLANLVVEKYEIVLL